MKSAYVALLTLAVPMVIEAQQAPAIQQANPITTAFRNRTMTLRRNIAQAFDSIPESKFSYKPTPAQQSIGYIAQHLASDNYYFCNNFGDMKATVPEKDTSTPDTVRAKWPKDTLVAKLKASIAFCESAMGQLEDSKLSQTFTVTTGGTTRGAAHQHAARPRDRPRRSLQPARELHAAERHAAADRAAAARPCRGARQRSVNSRYPSGHPRVVRT
jgi:hypothetical protein